MTEKKNNIKLIVCDIDGTLIGKDGILPAGVPILSKELEAKGIMFTLATGRTEHTASKYAKAMDLELPYVATNGATVTSTNGRTLLRLQFKAEYAREIILKADAYGLAVIYTVNGIEYAWNADAEYLSVCPFSDRAVREERKIMDEEWESLMIDKVSIMSSYDDAAIAVLEKMCEGHENHFHYTRYMDRSIELVNCEATKASGVEYLASSYGIKMEDVMFCGDHQNDVEIMLASGFGVAVGNATADAKENADYIAEGTQFEGVKEAVDRFVLT